MYVISTVNSPQSSSTVSLAVGMGITMESVEPVARVYSDSIELRSTTIELSVH